MRPGILAVLWILGCAAAAVPQHPAAEEAVAWSSVAGHVFCADTNAPARMATVSLQPADVVDGYQPEKSNSIATRAEAVQTLLDGSFSIPHVSPGVYYVLASAPGYLSSLSALAAMSGDEQQAKEYVRKKVAISAPRITVQANLPVSVNINLERGGGVSGTVLCDDGSPASGLSVRAMIHLKDQWVPLPSTPFDLFNGDPHTDDEGAYRLSGLPAQDYMVEVNLNLTRSIYTSDGHGGSGISTSDAFSLPIYSPGKARTKDAVPFHLKPGEERHGEDIQIPVRKLHMVRGSITAVRDGHVINGGSLTLWHADDRSMAGAASLTKEEDGFTFSFVPEGDYILRVDNAADTEYEEVSNPPDSNPPTRTESHPVRFYGSTEFPLHIGGDLSEVVVAVPDQPAEKGQLNH